VQRDPKTEVNNSKETSMLGHTQSKERLYAEEDSLERADADGPPDSFLPEILT